MKKMLVCMVAVTAVSMGLMCLCQCAASADPEGGGGPGRGGLLRDLARVNVTPEQRDQIRAVVRRYWPRMKPLLGKLHEARKEVRVTIWTTPLDEGKIRAAVYERAEAAAELAVLRARMTAEIKPILTPEQVEKLREFRGRVERRLESIPERVERFLGDDRS
jgi:Spy/CpxP family protein refolding chaperone